MPTSKKLSFRFHINIALLTEDNGESKQSVFFFKSKLVDISFLNTQLVLLRTPSTKAKGFK